MEVPGQLVQVVSDRGEFLRQFLQLRKIRHDMIMNLHFSVDSLMPDVLRHAHPRLLGKFLDGSILNIVQADLQNMRFLQFDRFFAIRHKCSFLL